ncbi:MAG: anaerobic selenocysteine-containing dehydrogenase [Planctomycetota bacterium]|jgi:anaerobic selenocysteine-containing dehydrogenase
MNETITKRTVCNRDCPDACSVLVDVVDGVAVNLRGDPDDPVTHGFLCERTSKFLVRQNSPDRFTQPMFRQDGKLVPISWDAALDLAASKLTKVRAEFGPAAILDYRSGGSLGMLTRLPSLLLSMFGPVTEKSGDICSGAGEAAQEADMGISESHDIFDTLNSKLVVIWGKDVHTSSVHLLPVLKKAQAGGARLIGLDVRSTKLKTLCDEFEVVRPGGDFDLAMGLARRLFDQDKIVTNAADFCDNFDVYKALVHRFETEDWAKRAGVSADFVNRLGDQIGENHPTSFQIGWGMARRLGGAATVRAIDALAAVSGNLGVAGGGANFLFGRSAPFDVDFGLPLSDPPRRLRESHLGVDILAASDPGIHFVWITAGNPVSMLPDSSSTKKALTECDFVVVVDTHPTDTTDVADLVLPTKTLIEDDDVMGAFGNHYLRASTPAVASPEGVWHELHIVQALAKRLDLGTIFDGSIRSWKERVTKRIRATGLSIDDLEQAACRSPFPPKVLFEGHKFETESGKFQLLTSSPAEARIDADYPLRLLATSSPKAQSSQWSVDPAGIVDRVRVHPDAATSFADGDRARLESRHGAMDVTLVFDAGQHPQVAYVPKGGMFRHGACPNSLIEAQETDLGGGAAYYDEPVRIVSLAN